MRVEHNAAVPECVFVERYLWPWAQLSEWCSASYLPAGVQAWLSLLVPTQTKNKNTDWAWRVLRMKTLVQQELTQSGGNTKVIAEQSVQKRRWTWMFCCDVQLFFSWSLRNLMIGCSLVVFFHNLKWRELIQAVRKPAMNPPNWAIICFAFMAGQSWKLVSLWLWFRRWRCIIYSAFSCCLHL